MSKLRKVAPELQYHCLGESHKGRYDENGLQELSGLEHQRLGEICLKTVNQYFCDNFAECKKTIREMKSMTDPEQRLDHARSAISQYKGELNVQNI